MYGVFFCFAASVAINDVNRPKESETGHQKRARLNLYPRGKPDALIFLRHHVPENELGDDGDAPVKRSVYNRPTV